MATERGKQVAIGGKCSAQALARPDMLAGVSLLHPAKHPQSRIALPHTDRAAFPCPSLPLTDLPASPAPGDSPPPR